MRKILITGSNGQLGRAINKLYEGDSSIILINTDVVNAIPLDITNTIETMDFIKSENPDVIINCAALTAVDLCETEIDSAYRINALGPRNLSIAANEVGAKMVHISTDYVFSGEANIPYSEFDIPNPKSVYGQTKLAGEEFVKQFADKYFIIRTAWLYGDGKNFIKTMLKLSETNKKVRVVDDQVGSPTSADQLAKAIECLIPTDNYGLFHGTCEGVCSWADFAEEIFKLYDKKVEVERISTDQYPTPAKRPQYSVLENYMFKLTSDFMFLDWKEALLEHIKKGL